MLGPADRSRRSSGSRNEGGGTDLQADSPSPPYGADVRPTKSKPIPMSQSKNAPSQDDSQTAAAHEVPVRSIDPGKLPKHFEGAAAETRLDEFWQR